MDNEISGVKFQFLILENRCIENGNNLYYINGLILNPFSKNPSILKSGKYLKESKFREFWIIDGNLNWNNYDLIFPVWDLYQGKI